MKKFIGAIFGLLFAMSTAHAKDNGLGKDAQDFINSLREGSAVGIRFHISMHVLSKGAPIKKK